MPNFRPRINPSVVTSAVKKIFKMNSTVYETNNCCKFTLTGMIVAKSHNNEDGYLFGMVICPYYFETKKFEIEFHGDLYFQKQRQCATDDKIFQMHIYFTKLPQTKRKIAFDIFNQEKMHVAISLARVYLNKFKIIRGENMIS